MTEATLRELRRSVEPPVRYSRSLRVDQWMTVAGTTPAPDGGGTQPALCGRVRRTGVSGVDRGGPDRDTGHFDRDASLLDLFRETDGAAGYAPIPRFVGPGRNPGIDPGKAPEGEYPSSSVSPLLFPVRTLLWARARDIPSR